MAAFQSASQGIGPGPGHQTGSGGHRSAGDHQGNLHYAAV